MTKNPDGSYTGDTIKVVPPPRYCSHAKIEFARAIVQRGPSFHLGVANVRIVMANCPECSNKVMYAKNIETGQLNVSVLDWIEVQQ